MNIINYVKKYFVFAEQIVYSLSTFIFTVFCARLMGVDYFGIFSLFFVALTLSVGLQRTIISEPLMVIGSEISENSAFYRYMSLSLLFSILIGAIVATLICFTFFVRGAGWSALGLFPLLIFPFVQDFSRYVYLLRKRLGALLFTTFVVTCSQFGALLFVAHQGPVTPERALFAWGCGSLVGASAFAVRMMGQFSFNQETRAQMAVSLRLGGQFAVDYLLGIATVQGVLFASTFVSGPSAAAALRGADSLVGPVRILLQAMPAVLLSKSSDLSQRIPTLRRNIFMYIILFWSVVLVWIILLLNVPPSIGSKILGQSWHVVRPVLPPVLFGLFANVVVAFATVGLKVMKRGDMLAKSRLLLVPFSSIISIGGALYAGAYGGAIGALITSLVAAFIWAKNFLTVARA
jgi:hypothetical protein